MQCILKLLAFYEKCNIISEKQKNTHTGTSKGEAGDYHLPPPPLHKYKSPPTLKNFLPARNKKRLNILAHTHIGKNKFLYVRFLCRFWPQEAIYERGWVNS